MFAAMFERISGLFSRDGSARRRRAADLYAAIALQARAAEPFRDLEVPDTLDGRFDSICLHALLVIRRLGREGEPGAVLARDLYDALFADMDRGLREMGVGDLGIARRVRQMAEALMGRVKAYDASLESGDGTALEAALRRNLYGTTETVRPQTLAAMARYVRACDAALAAQSIDAMSSAGPAFAAWETC
jgi:cytochrome b pre-mRNA-processing protein 3